MLHRRGLYIIFGIIALIAVGVVYYFLAPAPKYKDYSRLELRNFRRHYKASHILLMTDREVSAYITKWAHFDASSPDVYKMNGNAALLAINRPKVVLPLIKKLLDQPTKLPRLNRISLQTTLEYAEGYKSMPRKFSPSGF